MKLIKTPEPHTVLSHGGEQYKSDGKGLVKVPDAAADIFTNSHGCLDPDAEHQYGLSIKSVGKGKHVVVDADGQPVHAGKLDYSSAVAIMKNWTPDDGSESDDE